MSLAKLVRKFTQKASGLTDAELVWGYYLIRGCGIGRIRAGMILEEIKRNPAYQGRLFALVAAPEFPSEAAMLDCLELGKPNLFPAGTGEWADRLGAFVPVVRIHDREHTIVCGFLLGEGQSYTFTWSVDRKGVYA